MAAKNLLYAVYMDILHITYYAILNTSINVMRIKLLFTNKTSHCQVIAEKKITKIRRKWKMKTCCFVSNFST
jgi:type IV secretory pathway VirB3-like protein